MQPPVHNDVADPAAALLWLAQAGVDVVMEDRPQNRVIKTRDTAASETSLDAAKEKATGPLEAAKPASGLAQVAAALRLAADCTDLPSLRQALEAFDGCALKQTATQLVFADGSGDAKLMIIGEAPGRDEDEKGVPFVGAAGQLLDKILAATGLKRSEVYITNVVPWRPPGNRKPTPLETQICMPFMLRHIALAAPQVLLLLGGTPTTALTGLSQGITRLRGRWHDVTLAPDAKIQALPTFHPAYLLRQPSHKALVWQDMLLLQERLKH